MIGALVLNPRQYFAVAAGRITPTRIELWYKTNRHEKHASGCSAKREIEHTAFYTYFTCTQCDGPLPTSRSLRAPMLCDNCLEEADNV